MSDRARALAQATSHFWQGRYEEAARLLRDMRDSPRVSGLSGLVAWATGDLDSVDRTTIALRRFRTSAEAAVWAAGLAALGCRARGDVRMAWQHVAALRRAALKGGRADFVRLASVLEAEALDRGWEANGAWGRALRDAWARAPAFDRAARAWIEAAAGGDMARRITERQTAARHGLHGLTRWGWGSARMHLLHALPALLNLVQEAEDERAALAGSCRWIRQQCAAEAVAFAASDGRLMASDGPIEELAGGPLEALRAGREHVANDAGLAIAIIPMRAGGAAIGGALVRGPDARAATIEQAARTLAAVCAPALRARLDAVALATSSHALTPEILGRSPEIVALRESIARAAVTPFHVLVEGESGTGKELVARALHRLSARRDRRFCAVNCAALGDEIVEAELFGHARGAFTGAVAPRAGLFEEAHLGTLFLDEVRELSARGQAKLLRALQEREIRRLGENAPRAVDVRVVAATNQPLADGVARGEFREDLLFRLAVVRLRLPPLRDRLEDVPMLALACWRQMSVLTGKRAVLGPDALAALCRHAWPGNVRELQNAIAGLLVVAPARGRVNARHVAQVLEASRGGPAVEPWPLLRTRLTCERRAVAAALARHAGRRVAAARELGLTRQGLTKAMKRLGLGTDPPGEAGVA